MTTAQKLTFKRNGAGGFNDAAIDAVYRNPTKETYTLDEIAAIAQCSRQNIMQLQRRALHKVAEATKKLRAELYGHRF